MNKQWRLFVEVSLVVLVCAALVVSIMLLRESNKSPRLSEPFTLDHKLKLNAYINNAYAKLAQARGHDAAIEEIGRFLDGQKILKSWRYDAVRNELWTTFLDGQTTSSMLTWKYLPKNWPPLRDAPSSGGVSP